MSTDETIVPIDASLLFDASFLPEDFVDDYQHRRRSDHLRPSSKSSAADDGTASQDDESLLSTIIDELGTLEEEDVVNDNNKDNDKEREEKRRRNRVAAAACRLKKKRRLEELSSAATVLKQKLQRSNEMCSNLAKENHVLRVHLAHLARFANAREAAEKARELHLPPLPKPIAPPSQQAPQPTLVVAPPPSSLNTTTTTTTLNTSTTTEQGGSPPPLSQKIPLPLFNPQAYAPRRGVDEEADVKDDSQSNTNPPRRRRKTKSVVATATALACSTACVLSNTNKAVSVVSRTGAVTTLATNVGRVAPRHLTALSGSFNPLGGAALEDQNEDTITSPDLKQALEMNWTMSDEVEAEKNKHSKAVAFASEAIKNLPVKDAGEEKEEENNKNDKNSTPMLSDKEANRIDPWFAAFRAAKMHAIQKMTRIGCERVFSYKLEERENADAHETTAASGEKMGIATRGEVKETLEQRIARKRASDAIPLDDGTEPKFRMLQSQNPQSSPQTTMTTMTSTEVEYDDNDFTNPSSSSVVSMLLPPWEITNGAKADKSASSMLRRLAKTFVVTFSRNTGVYTTYACKLPTGL